MCIIDRDFSLSPIASTGFPVFCCSNAVSNLYLFYYLLSPIFDKYANSSDNSKGVAYPAINDNKLYKAVVAIPPRKEQERICQEIKQLFGFIEKDGR